MGSASRPLRSLAGRLAAALRSALLAAVAVAAAGPVLGHETHDHAEGQAGAIAEVPAGTESGSEDAAREPFPVDIGGPFTLVDHTGRPVTDGDYRGRFLLVFFGYARCDSICPVGLKRMTEALDLLGGAGESVQPILITVDPENDTPEVLAAHLPTIHPRLIGLTGAPEDIAAAMKAYKVNAKLVGQTWKGTPRISHGSYIYLMGPDGKLLSVLPPVLSPEAMAGIIRGYLDQS
jgi:protein SCO1/2